MSLLALTLSYAVLAIVGVLVVAMWIAVLRREFGREWREHIEEDQRKRERVGL